MREVEQLGDFPKDAAVVVEIREMIDERLGFKVNKSFHVFIVIEVVCLV